MVQETEYQIRDVFKALQLMRSLTGIDNSEGVTNWKSVKDKEKQNVVLKMVAKAIVEVVSIRRYIFECKPQCCYRNNG